MRKGPGPVNSARYEITPDGRTILENYNAAKPFASFFPGVAGLDGIPLWVFYVNRGQCISSFGVADKNHAMLDFSSANVACRTTPLLGFRTFLKVAAGREPRFYEPFRPTLANQDYGAASRMTFSGASVGLWERNPALGIEVEVAYVTVPQEPYPALARRVAVKNVGTERIAVEWVDGLPWVTAYGLDAPTSKLMTYTSKSWVAVTHLENDAPYYQLRCRMSDSPDLEYYDRGNFALYWDESGRLPAIVDGEAVFGPNTDLDVPRAFLEARDYTIPARQTVENCTPSAMTHVKASLDPGAAKSICGLFGQVRGLDRLDEIADGAAVPGWFDEKLARNRRIMAELQNHAATFSADPVYDHYCRSTFLDNVLRGGLPVTLPDASGRRRTFHVFSRIHGDMERDYNAFQLEPAFWSQGNGGYRDVNQNRRNDIYFNTDVRDDNIRTFMNWIRLDGYNPHFLLGTEFRVRKASDLDALLARVAGKPEAAKLLAGLLAEPFTPGRLLTEIAERRIDLNVSAEQLLAEVMARSERSDLAEPVSGFWTDHWHYNLDLIDSFLSVFPEELESLLFGDNGYTYFQSPAKVNPRTKRYVLRNGKPFQGVAIEIEGGKDARTDPRECVARTRHGSGKVYRTCLCAKLLALVPLKMATLDPFGVGIEFEAGRPNWNDSLNGLPGIFGSSTCETFELRRLIRFLLDAGEKTGVASAKVHKELAELMAAVEAALRETGGETQEELFAYWDRTNTAKEAYRAATRRGVDGEETELPAARIAQFLRACLGKVDRGLTRAIDPETGLVNAYFYHEVLQYDTVERDGQTCIVPRKFRQVPTAPFLEGPVHYLRTAADRTGARRQYLAVRSSELFDRKLKMYKVCGSMASQPHGLGRIVIFSPGWLENESIWMHMEYKYLLEVLRSGLYREFFDDLRTVLIPFQDPQRYGRSVLENSSFLVSSANPNPDLHGRGFYGRLSGSTAEWVHLWVHMNLGGAPFTLGEDGELRFQMRPALPAWMFSRTPGTAAWLRSGREQQAPLPEHHYAFVLFNKTLVVYVNPTGRDTVGPKAPTMRRVELTTDDGRAHTMAPAELKGRIARNVRDGEFRTITAFFE